MDFGDVDSSLASDGERDFTDDEYAVVDGDNDPNETHSKHMTSLNSRTRESSPEVHCSKTETEIQPQLVSLETSNQSDGVETLPQQVRRSARLAAIADASKKRPQLHSPLNFLKERNAVIKLRQAADKSLFRVQPHAIGSVPVCSFEFKGPRAHLPGLFLVEGVSSGKKGTPSSGNLSDPVAARRGATASSSEGSTTEPTNRSAPEALSDTNEEGTDIYVKGGSAKEVADNYNTLFSKAENLYQNNPNRSVIMPIVQVLCQGILTQSGCVVLTNHQTAIAFRLEENPETKKADVFVTGVIPCDREPGNFAAMLAIVKYSLEKTIGKSDEELIASKRRILRRVSHSHYENYPGSKTKKLDKNWHPGSEENQESETNKKPRNTGKREDAELRGMDSGAYEPRGIMKPKAAVGDSRNSLQARVDDCSVLSDIVCNPQPQRLMFGFRENGIPSSETNKRSRMDERLREMFETTEGIIAVGGSGLVLRGIWNGIKAAVKIWNGESLEGFLNIRREIDTFKLLQSRSASALGSAVPRMLLGWDNPEQSSVYRKEVLLITEIVGHDIARDPDGNLLVNNCDVNETDARLICHAALESLTKLHSNGFLHGDVALRNLRVEYKADKAQPEKEREWKAWWVDLGLASEMTGDAKENSYLMGLERNACASLFWETKLCGADMAHNKRSFSVVHFSTEVDS